MSYSNARSIFYDSGREESVSSVFVRSGPVGGVTGFVGQGPRAIRRAGWHETVSNLPDCDTARCLGANRAIEFDAPNEGLTFFYYKEIDELSINFYQNNFISALNKSVSYWGLSGVSRDVIDNVNSHEYLNTPYLLNVEKINTKFDETRWQRGVESGVYDSSNDTLTITGSTFLPEWLEKDDSIFLTGFKESSTFDGSYPIFKIVDTGDAYGRTSVLMISGIGSSTDDTSFANPLKATGIGRFQFTGTHLRGKIPFYPKYEKEKSYKLTSIPIDDEKFLYLGLPNEDRSSVFGDVEQYRVPLETPLIFTPRGPFPWDFPPFKFPTHIPEHIDKDHEDGKGLPILAGHTGFLLHGPGADAPSIKHISSGVDNYIIAPGYYRDNYLSETVNCSSEGNGNPWVELYNITSDPNRVPTTLDMRYSFIGAGTLARDGIYHDAAVETCVTLEDVPDNSVTHAQFTGEIGEALDEWKKIFENLYSWLTLNFINLGDEDDTWPYFPALPTPSDPDANAYWLTTKFEEDGGEWHGIGDLRFGMHNIDGNYNVVGHAWFPGGSIGHVGNVGGDTHFDSSEDWRLDTTDEALDADAVSIKYITAHELGHVFGLGHSTDSKSLMYPTVTTSHNFHELFPDGMGDADKVCLAHLYSPKKIGFGYDAGGVPSGSPSGELVSITGIHQGRYVTGILNESLYPDCTYLLGKKLTSKDAIPCTQITGNYWPGSPGVSTSSILGPLSSDLDFGDVPEPLQATQGLGGGGRFHVKSLLEAGGSPRFFMASGVPAQTAYDETPVYTLNRGYEYLFDMTHATNYENEIHFSYSPDADKCSEGCGDEITGWYEINAPASDYAYNNYTLYDIPAESAFTVPITGESQSYLFRGEGHQPGLGEVSFKYEQFEMENRVCGLNVNNINAEGAIVTGWLDPIKNIGKKLRLYDSNEKNWMHFDISGNSANVGDYTEILIDPSTIASGIIKPEGNFVTNDSLTISPSGDSRIYYYSNLGTGYGGAGYFNITDSGHARGHPGVPRMSYGE